MNEKIGYDELLHARVEQLKGIDEQLEQIGKRLSRSATLIAQDAEHDIQLLRNELADMIRLAEEEHTHF